MAAILDFTGKAALPTSENCHCKHYRHHYREDNSYRSKHMAISAVLDILAGILDSGDMIEKNFRNGCPALDYPKMDSIRLASPSILKVK